MIQPTKKSEHECTPPFSHGNVVEKNCNGNGTKKGNAADFNSSLTSTSMPDKKRKKYRKQHKKKKSMRGKRDEIGLNENGDELSGGWLDKNPTLSRKDRKILTGYLLAYKKATFRNLNKLKGIKQSEESVVDDSFSKSSVSIAGRQFPALTEEIISSPYLVLPEMKSKKQRVAVHGICVDLDLFHDSIGRTTNSRKIAISVYCDGLDHCPEVSPRTNPVSIHEFHPWACRRSQRGTSGAVTRKVDAQTLEGKEAIQTLVDQPGKCLRSGIDFLDFEKMKNDDLSHIQPPAMAGCGDSWILVDSAPKMKECIKELDAAQPTEIAFDLEAHNKSNYVQQTALIQITSNAGKEYVIDTLAPGVWECVSGLAPVFANPEIVKIGHSISGLDARCLHRDFGILIVNAFDTHEAARYLPDRTTGLAKLCGYYGMSGSPEYQMLKDEYQNSNWRERPLTKDMILYGLHDIHYLIPLRRLLMRDLAQPDLYDQPYGFSKDEEARHVASSLAEILRKCDEDDEEYGFGGMYANDSRASVGTSDGDEPNNSRFHTPTSVSVVDEDEFQECMDEPRSYFDAAELRMNSSLMYVLSISQDRCLDLWNAKKVERHLENETFVKYVERSKHGEITLRQSQLRLFDQLARWREHVARLEECLPGFCCSLDFLAQVSYRRPADHISLRRIVYFLPGFLSNISKDGDGNTTYEDELLSLVQSSRNEDGDDESEEWNTYSAIPSYKKDYQAAVASIHSRRKWMWAGAGTLLAAGVAVFLSTLAQRHRQGARTRH